jgi:hypothetical protein
MDVLVDVRGPHFQPLPEQIDEKIEAAGVKIAS